MHTIRHYVITLSLLLVSIIPAQAEVYDDIKSLGNLLLNLENRYVDTVNVDALTEVAIRAILKELDPHSTYLTPSEVNDMNEGLGGSFEGIGVRYQMENDTLLVINTINGGPSEKVGILPGDRIIMVGDSTIAGQKFGTKEIQRRLRGPKGSQVHLGINRQGESELLWFNVKRDKIPVYSVDAHYMATPTVGYIRIARFGQTTPEEVSDAIDELETKGMKDLIIDLQSNGGGYLNSAVELANLFLPGQELVVFTEGRTDERRNYVTRSFRHYFHGRLAVLIDEQSASASEIFAGCMQDLDRGVIIGRRSFGKGLVQSPIRLNNGGMVRLTVSQYYTPSGRCIQKPFTKGDQKSYHEDLLNRLHNGEFLSADSIHMVDSLRYYTRNGRLVYGGGGIMPDLFVPLDTTRISKAHRAVLAKGSINRYMVSYFRQHQTQLHQQYPTLDAFVDPVRGYKLSDDMVQGVIDQARSDSAQSTELDELLTNQLFRTQITAYLANDLYEQGAYNRIMNSTSQFFLQALDLLADRPRYNATLSTKQ